MKDFEPRNFTSVFEKPQQKRMVPSVKFMDCWLPPEAHAEDPRREKDGLRSSGWSALRFFYILVRWAPISYEWGYNMLITL